jgi:hypothetical protein
MLMGFAVIGTALVISALTAVVLDTGYRACEQAVRRQAHTRRRG